MTETSALSGAAGAASRNVSRRTLVKAAAWAAPVVAVTVAVPAASASEPEPLPTRFYYTIGYDQTTVGNVVRNLSVTGGNVIIEGSPGDSAGTIVITIWIPTGYTWQEAATPYGWTKTTPATGSPRVIYTLESALTVPVGANSATAWFPGGTLVGSGASPTNAASLRINSSVYGGGRTYWPEAEEE
jgi:hypothetical protein